MEQLIIELATKHPIILSVIAFVGVLRLLMKPISEVLHKVVDLTESKSDNEFLARIEASKVYGWLMWVINYLGSIKVPKVTDQKKPDEVISIDVENPKQDNKES